MCDESNERLFNEKCKKIQELDERHNPLMYKIIEEMHPSNGKEVNEITDEDGRLLTRKEDVIQRFAEYIEELYDDKREQSPQFDREELPIAQSMNQIGEAEVRTIIEELKNGQVNGVDEISAEMHKYLG